MVRTAVPINNILGVLSQFVGVEAINFFELVNFIILVIHPNNMRKKSFNHGMGKLMNKGYSKQSAFNVMRRLATKNRRYNQYKTVSVPSWVRYLFALIMEFILFAYKVPSKEEVQIMLIRTIIPLSDATKPLAGFVTIIAIIMQVASLLLIYDLLAKLFNAFRRKFDI